jgi:hypothetical protein
MDVAQIDGTLVAGERRTRQKSGLSGEGRRPGGDRTPVAPRIDPIGWLYLLG